MKPIQTIIGAGLIAYAGWLCGHAVYDARALNTLLQDPLIQEVHTLQANPKDQTSQTRLNELTRSPAYLEKMVEIYETSNRATDKFLTSVLSTLAGAAIAYAGGRNHQQHDDDTYAPRRPSYTR